jgi:hypothetical protein
MPSAIKVIENGELPFASSPQRDRKLQIIDFLNKLPEKKDRTQLDRLGSGS